jgi:hypothetical protein
MLLGSLISSFYPNLLFRQGEHMGRKASTWRAGSFLPLPGTHKHLRRASIGMRPNHPDAGGSGNRRLAIEWPEEERKPAGDARARPAKNRR